MDDRKPTKLVVPDVTDLEARAQGLHPIYSQKEVLALISQIRSWKRICGLLESKSAILESQQQVQLSTIKQLSGSLIDAHDLIKRQTIDPFERVEAQIRRLRECC